MEGARNPLPISTKQERIAQIAQRTSEPIQNIAHLIDVLWLKEAFARTRKDGARGVDGVTAAEYELNLDENLQNLLNRMKSGTYRALPARRVYIPKEKPGEMRALGIPALEDKILQRAVLMAIEPVYEHDFLPCSYGFRPGRGAHDAVFELQKILHKSRTAWVVEMDIRRCFDTIPHVKLQELVRERVSDGIITRMIGKWLNAGIFEDGGTKYSDIGCPQGSVISPVLMNVYLHMVLDRWFHNTVTPRLQGKARMVRYADDAVFIFDNKRDAERFLEPLYSRFARYGLTLHPEKTRLLNFNQPKDEVRPQTFSFLGFTFYWGKSQKGTLVLKAKTEKSRLKRAKGNIKRWVKKNRHLKVKQQWSILCKKVRGHYGYYGVSTNIRSLLCFLQSVQYIWQKWLNRRSQRAKMSFTKFHLMIQTYPLPLPYITHRWF